MNSTGNTEVVRKAWQAFGSRDAEVIAAFFHPDARWTAPAGNATAVALDVPSDMIGRDAIVKFLVTDVPRLYADIRIDFRSFFEDRDTVIVEETMHATLPDGRKYENDYCFFFEVRAGRIAAMREYMDTARGQLMVFGK